MNAQRQQPLALAGLERAQPTARWYFAFGSNLDTAQMAHRCPTARAVRTAVLRGFELAFVGYSATWDGAVATVQPRARATVRGLLYRMTDEDFERLDRFEGHPFVYERREIAVSAAHVDRAETYVLEGELGAPARAYLERIARAYDALGFPITPLLRAARRSITTEDE